MYALWPVGVLLGLAAVANRWQHLFIGIQLALHLIDLGWLWTSGITDWTYAQVLFIRTGVEAWFYVNAALANAYHAWVFSGLVWLSRVNTHASALGLGPPPTGNLWPQAADQLFQQLLTFETLSTAVVLCKATETQWIAWPVAVAWAWYRVVEFGYLIIAKEGANLLLWSVWVMQAILLLHLVLWIKALAPAPVAPAPAAAAKGKVNPRTRFLQACADDKVDLVTEMLASRELDPAANDNEAILCAGPDTIKLLWRDPRVQETLSYAQSKLLLKRVPDILDSGESESWSDE
jgi:hypothetical protein